jgi:glutamyl-tRNA reductase
MDFVVLGLNHRTAPIEIRECLAFPKERMEEALTRVKDLPSMREGMIVSTCNRVEVYGAARETERAISELSAFLGQFHRLADGSYEKSLYAHAGEDAVRHVFRVASSLDSMVKGEPQILGQIKEAYGLAARFGTSGLLLNKLLHRAFSVAKRVRTETGVASSAVSVSSVAVDLARKIFDTLQGKTVLLIGAGEMCELAAQHLVSGGVAEVLVTNRTYERAENLALQFRGRAIPFDDMAQGLRKADIVISATGADHHILEHDPIVRVMKDRRQKPLFLIDIADPRDIDPRVGDLENVYLYDVDDLQNVASDHLHGREREAQKAESIVDEEVRKFVEWYQTLDVTPTITALRKKFEEIRRKELEKTLSRHPDLTDRERESLEAMTSAIVSKILHGPFALLKQADGETTSDLYVDALRTLFNLEDGPDGRK